MGDTHVICRDHAGNTQAMFVRLKYNCNNPGTVSCRFSLGFFILLHKSYLYLLHGKQRAELERGTDLGKAGGHIEMSAS